MWRQFVLRGKWPLAKLFARRKSPFPATVAGVSPRTIRTVATNPQPTKAVPMNLPPNAWDKSPGTIPQGDLIKVGAKCFVSLDGNWVTAWGRMEDSETYSIWVFDKDEDAPQATLRLPENFPFKHLRSGLREKKGDQIPITDSLGEPLPQILVLVALHTGKLSDWTTAIRSWELVRSDLLERPEDAAAKGLAFLKDQDALLPEPPEPFSSNLDCPDTHLAHVKDWAAGWFLGLVVEGHLDLLRAWDRAARRTIERLSLVGRDFTLVDQLTGDESSETFEMRRILRAARRATAVLAGVPHRAKIRSILKDHEGLKADPSKLRSMLRTVGLEWIPSEADWQKHWAPVAESRGWL